MEALGASSLLTQIIIRPLRAEDLPALEWGGEYRHYRRLYRDIYQSMVQGRTLMWVVELPEAGVIGQIFVQLLSVDPSLADGHERAYLYAFRVKPAYRNQGVGSQLLHYVEQDLWQRGFRRLYLAVGRDNTAALRFYQRHGYTIVAAQRGGVVVPR